MSSEAIDEVLNTWPPDYRLDGAVVEAMIRDMPARAHMPEQRPERVMDSNAVARASPVREVPGFDEKMIEALFHGVRHLRILFKRHRREWPLANYTVLLVWHIGHGLVNVAFCPKVDTFVQGFPFEVADKGMFRNGPGVNFILSLSDYTLVKTVRMR